MLQLTLTAEQQRELQLVSRQTIGRVALRAHMVLVSGRGCPVSQIALIHECGEDVVRTWLHRYQRHGVAGLHDRPKSGRPPKERLAGPISAAQASPSPRCSGHVHACWSVGRLPRFLASRCRLRLSPSSVRRYRYCCGWRWARPRRAPAVARHPDPAASTKLAAIADAGRPASAGLAHRLFLDESDGPLLPVVRAMGMNGPRVRLPPPGQHALTCYPVYDQR